MNKSACWRVLALMVMAFLAPLAAAQAWPAKTVKIIAVFPPGGSVDQVSRIFAAHLTTQLGSQFIPYRGGGPLMTDAIGGQVPLAIGTTFLVNPHVKGGKVKALGVTSAKPTAQMPGVAPVSEQGAPGFAALAWWGVIAPAGTPPAIVKRMYEELAKALKTPAVAEKLTAQGMEIVGGGPEDLDKFLRGEIDRWAKVVKDNKIRAGD